MPRVEFIYDSECPNVKPARENLVKAFAEAKISPKWTEFDRNSEESPSHVRKYGSPTILVDGEDIGGETPQDGNNCRIYSVQGNSSGVPPIELIAKALKNPQTSSSGWKAALAAIPGIGIILLPKLTCAACWPAYAAIMSSMGVGYFNYTEYLFPISIAALIVTLIALAYKANSRRGYGPFFLGLTASVIALLGKFHFESDPVFYASVSFLLVASLWNSWPVKTNSQDTCSACEPLT